MILLKFLHIRFIQWLNHYSPSGWKGSLFPSSTRLRPQATGHEQLAHHVITFWLSMEPACGRWDPLHHGLYPQLS